MSMRRVESGLASVKADKDGKEQLIYTHYDHPEKFTFYIEIPAEGKGFARVSAYRGDMNDFDAKDLAKRQEYLKAAKEKTSGGGETKGPVTRPVAKSAAKQVADPEMDESFNF